MAGTSSAHPARGHLQLQKRWGVPEMLALRQHKSCSSPHRSAVPTSSYQQLLFCTRMNTRCTAVPVLAGAGSCAWVEGDGHLVPIPLAKGSDATPLLMHNHCHKLDSAQQPTITPAEPVVRGAAKH